LKRPHLAEQAEVVIARQAVGAQTDFEPESAQFFELKRRMPEILMAAGTVDDVKAVLRSVEEIKIARRQFIQVDGDPLVVSTDGETTLNPPSPYSQWYQRIIAQSGVGAYTYVLKLSRMTPLTGALFRIQFEIAQSANPTIEVYDNLELVALQTISGDSSNATNALLELEYDGSAWQVTALNFIL